jgi:hypothetical protein
MFKFCLTASIFFLFSIQGVHAQDAEKSPTKSLKVLQGKVTKNRDDFANALKKIQGAIESSKEDSEKQIAQINSIITMIKAQIKEASSEGELYKQIELAVSKNQEYSKRYADKSVEAGLRPEHVQKYEELASRFKKNTQDLTKGKLEMMNVKASLEKKVVLLEEEKVLIVELLKAQEWEDATSALLKAVQGLNEINDSLNNIVTVVEKTTSIK